MPSAMERIRKRRAAIAKLEEVSRYRETVVLVHYSCESFYDRPEGRSPRITSIAVRNLGSAQTTSFSIHQVAERRGIASSDIKKHYDDLERAMLEEWYTYIGRHTTSRWLHWNMRDANYGFPAIAHRFRVLGGTPAEVEESRLFDFAKLLIDVYSPEYASHPRFQTLSKLNHISLKDFLGGQEEADAFDAGEYVKLHQSTLRKVDVMANLFNRYEDGKLETQNEWWQPYGSRILGAGEWCRDHPIVALIMVAIAIVSMVLGAVALI